MGLPSITIILVFVHSFTLKLTRHSFVSKSMNISDENDTSTEIKGGSPNGSSPPVLLFSSPVLLFSSPALLFSSSKGGIVTQDELSTTSGADGYSPLLTTIHNSTLRQYSSPLSIIPPGCSGPLKGHSSHSEWLVVCVVNSYQPVSIGSSELEFECHR